MAIEISPSVRLVGTVICEEPVKIWANCTISDSSIGAFSYVSPGCNLHRLTIGRYCSIGDGVMVLSSHPTGGLTSSPFPYQALFVSPFDTPPPKSRSSLGDTFIGNDVWIGSGVRIKTGVRIGDGAIVGAGSVVTKDISPFTVVGGVPARIIRHRFDASTCERIQSLAWWRFNLLGLDISWEDIAAALDQLEQKIEQNLILPYKYARYQVLQKDGKFQSIKAG